MRAEGFLPFPCSFLAKQETARVPGAAVDGRWDSLSAFRSIQSVSAANPQREASFWEDSTDVRLAGIKAQEKLKQGCL